VKGRDLRRKLSEDEGIGLFEEELKKLREGRA